MMTPSARRETYEWCRNVSRLWMLEMWTSSTGSPSQVLSASRIATEVCE